MEKTEKLGNIRDIYEEQLDIDSCKIFSTLSDSFDEDTFRNPIIVYGLQSSPDFGYFELGRRYWASSVCIYLVGAADGFHGNGFGYTEPWLFLARHSMELCLKSMNLYLIWLNALQLDRYQNLAVDINDLLKQFNGNRHDLLTLYNNYKTKNQEISQLSPVPDFVFEGIGAMVLSADNEEILIGLSEIDKNSFRFRYPTLKVSEKIEIFQEIGWRHNQDIDTKTQLAKSSGAFFNHLDVFEKLTILYQGLYDICNGFENSGILVEMEQQEELHQLYQNQLHCVEEND